MFRPNFTTGLLQVILPRPTIGITAFHSCCLSQHVFDQVNLWPAWVGFETAIFWQCSPGTVEIQRLYPLRHGPRRGDQGWIFWSYKSLSVPHLGSFCVVSSFTTFRPNFTTGLLQVILPRPRIGMLSLVTVSPVITASHSCCLSHHVKKARGEIWPKRSERRNNTKTTKMRTKSPQ